MEIEGRIHKVSEPASGFSKSSGNAWMSQEFVLAYYWYPNQQYPSYMSCRMFGKDKVTSSNLQPNDEVRITFSVEARESDSGRWFNEVRVSSILKKQPDGTFVSPQGLHQGSAAAPAAQGGTTAQPAENNGTQANSEKDDLPF